MATTPNGDREGRRDPEALLRQIEAAERAERRGQLKIFLGYTKGVGKTFRLIDEARRRHERGEDVVVAAVQPHMSPDAEDALRTLEVIPPLAIDGSAVVDVANELSTRLPVVALSGTEVFAACEAPDGHFFQALDHQHDVNCAYTEPYYDGFSYAFMPLVGSRRSGRELEPVPRNAVHGAQAGVLVVE